MGLFSFFQKKQTLSQDVKGEADLELYTPISGNLISLRKTDWRWCCRGTKQRR